MLQTHLTKPSGTNAPGVANKIYLAPLSWFDELQEAPAVETTPGLNIIITTTHTFTVASPLRGFVEMYTTPRSAEFSAKQVGDIDSYGIDNVIEAWSPSISAPLFSLMAAQDEYIVLVKDIDCSTPRYFQLGTSCSPALKREWEFKTGKAGGEGKKGTTIKFDAYHDRIFIYTGTVTTAVQP